MPGLMSSPVNKSVSCWYFLVLFFDVGSRASAFIESGLRNAVTQPSLCSDCAMVLEWSCPLLIFFLTRLNFKKTQEKMMVMLCTDNCFKTVTAGADF